AQAQLQAQGLSRPNRRGGSDPCDPWRGALAGGRSHHGLDEEFGISVWDEKIFLALKKLGLLHMSARAKAYKHNAEAMDAFKKTSPSVWRKSARSLHPAHW